MFFLPGSVRSRAFVVSMLMYLTARSVGAAEWSIESSIGTTVLYDQNIFLESTPRDAVSNLVITPSIKALAKEKDWEIFIDSKLRNHSSTNRNLDRNDKFFDIAGSYFSERDTLSLNGTYDLTSSLNNTSGDFSISQKRVNRELWRMSPLYVRMITERLILQLAYDHTDVEYINAANTTFVPYVVDMVSGSLAYNLTELDRLSFSLQTVDYESKDKENEYQMIISSVGMMHNLSKAFSLDYKLGASRRDSISRRTSTFVFFGQPITISEVTDFGNNGVVLDIGFNYSWQTCSLNVRVDRENTTDSFGGLSESDEFLLVFKKNITELFAYSISAKYENIESVSAGNSFSDRKLMEFEPELTYFLDRNWNIHASYRYNQREFTANSSSDEVPQSHRVLVRITYNFLPLSTF